MTAPDCIRCGQPAEAHPPQPDRLALATRVIKARRQSLCASCHAPILVGNQIARLTSPDGWCHVQCVPIVRDTLAKIAASYTEGKRP